MTATHIPPRPSPSLAACLGAAQSEAERLYGQGPVPRWQPAFDRRPWIAAAAYPKYGHPVSDRELLDQLSPLLRANALVAPLLLVHGLNDTNVPPSESQQMYDALRALGHTVEQLLFEDDGHEIDKRENRAVLVKAMCDWLTTSFARTPNT